MRERESISERGKPRVVSGGDDLRVKKEEGDDGMVGVKGGDGSSSSSDNESESESESDSD